MTKEGLPGILQKIEEYFALVKGNGYYAKKRREQARFWMYESINESLKNMFYENPVIEKLLPEYEDSVLEGESESFTAATELIEKYQRAKKRVKAMNWTLLVDVLKTDCSSPDW